MDSFDHIVSSKVTIFLKVVGVDCLQVLVQRIICEILGVANAFISHRCKISVSMAVFLPFGVWCGGILRGYILLLHIFHKSLLL
jgi:hypothetical protein